jgi:hypothetical protein
VGAVRDGERLVIAIGAPTTIKLQFDYARHRRVLNFTHNYVRLNEFPEWFTVDENHLYRLRQASASEGQVYLGSELVAGVELSPGDWVLERAGTPPYAKSTKSP